MAGLVVAPYAKTSQNSDFKIPPNLLLRRLYHYQLKSEPHGRVFLHLSNMLNRMVASICFFGPWLWSYRQKRSKFRQ